MPVTPRRNMLFAALLSPVLGAEAGPTPCEPVAPEAEKAAISKVVTAMEAAWNRGDFRG